MAIEANASIFPTKTVVGDFSQQEGGLTIRQHFAGQALQGLLASVNKWEPGVRKFDDFGNLAVQAADDLINALKVKPKKSSGLTQELIETLVRALGYAGNPNYSAAELQQFKDECAALILRARGL